MSEQHITQHSGNVSYDEQSGHWVAQYEDAVCMHPERASVERWLRLQQQDQADRQRRALAVWGVGGPER